MWEYKAKILKAIDGDTVDVDMDLGFHIRQKIRIRLFGIDTPERGKPGFDEAKKFVADYEGCEAIIVTMKDKREKYGRYLGRIYINGEKSCLNDVLVEKKLAVRFMHDLAHIPVSP